MAEYSNVVLQTVAVDDNVLFENGTRACRKGFISHRDDSGIFFLKGATNGCKAVYRVTFDGNIAVATDGGTVEPISVALTINGEALGNGTAVASPTVAGAFFNVAISTFIEIPCSCCVTVSVENTSGTPIDVTNANIIFERVA